MDDINKLNNALIAATKKYNASCWELVSNAARAAKASSAYTDRTNILKDKLDEIQTFKKHVENDILGNAQIEEERCQTLITLIRECDNIQKNSHRERVEVGTSQAELSRAKAQLEQDREALRKAIDALVAYVTPRRVLMSDDT